MLVVNLKEKIKTVASELGFQHTVIGSLEPLDGARIELEAWLARGFAASMNYLKPNAHFRTSPQLLYPYARSAIVVSVSYYSPSETAPGLTYGRVAGYAVGLDYHHVIKTKLRELRFGIEKIIGRPLMGKAYADNVSLYEQAFACQAGLGFAGKNSLVIGARLTGSYGFVAELFCDLELEPDEPYQGTCGKCFRCGNACPTGAIVGASCVDANFCISYLTIENKGSIPLVLRPKIGAWVFGCDLCQQVCPYNQSPPQTPWTELLPTSGVGHFLELFGLLAVKDESEFKRRFGLSPLSRAKRRGLLRNALVVLGNLKPEGGVRRILEFVLGEADPMLREHACWAIAQYKNLTARRALQKVYALELNLEVKTQVKSYLYC